MNITANEELLPLTPQTYHVLIAMLFHSAMAGADVTRQVEIDSNKLIKTSPGSTYPALRKLKDLGMIYNPTIDPRIYRITDHGIFLLEQETNRLERAAKLARSRMADWEATRPNPASAAAIAELMVG